MTALAPTLESFFTDYLQSQLDASPHTIAAYRDTWRLLLRYVYEQTGIAPSDLDLSVIDAPLVGEFLTGLETQRHNSPRTRNARLGAIHSLFRHAALRHPEHAAQIARVLAIPTKNTGRSIISWLTDPEIDALLDVPDEATWTGRRDRLLLTVMVTTGIRVGEITALTRADSCLERPGAHIACRGKGRKDRVVPIDVATSTLLGAWFAETPGAATTPLFCARGTARAMTADASPAGSPSAPRGRHKPVRASPPKTSRLTCCITHARCGCSPAESTPPPSPSGSATSLPRRRTPTYMPTSTSSSEPSTALLHSGRRPAASGPTTGSPCPRTT